MKIKKIYWIIILVLILLAIGISGYFNSNISYSNYTNQYMSFQYPTGWTVENDSVGGVNIYNGTKNNHDQWIVVVPYGNFGENMGNFNDFNNAINLASSGTQSPKIENQTINGINCLTIDNLNIDESDGAYSWKYCYFIKNGEGIEVKGNVKEISTLEHIVATFK